MTWAPATAVNVRAGDVVAVSADWGPRIITVRGVDHGRPGRPVVITTITGMTLRLPSRTPVAIREDKTGRYNRDP